MSFGIQIFDTSGALVWDSTTVTDGCVIDVLTVSPGSTPTFEYPSLAGRSVSTQPIQGQTLGTLSTDGGDFGVTSDTSLGYPRVVCASSPVTRTFLVFADA